MKIKKTASFMLSLLFAGYSLLSSYAYPLDVPVSEEKEVPVIMYHNVLNKKSLLGKFVITPSELEGDLAYLKEHGFESVVIADLIDFVDYGKPLPEKPIMLTFDDGDYAVYSTVFPLLEKYGMKAVVSVIGKFTDKYSEKDQPVKGPYPNLTWEQINELIESRLVEIQNHTYGLHSGAGAKKRAGESEDGYRQRLVKDLNALQKRMFEMTCYKASAVAYPFGIKSSSTDDIVKQMGFRASISCNEKINKIKTGEPDCLYSLGRYLRPHGISPEKYFARFE